jgi:hypothetical protein
VGYSNTASAVRSSGETDLRIGSDFTSDDVDERIAHCHLLAPVSLLILSSMPDIDMSPREMLCGTIIAIIHRAIADRSRPATDDGAHRRHDASTALR